MNYTQFFSNRIFGAHFFGRNVDPADLVLGWIDPRLQAAIPAVGYPRPSPVLELLHVVISQVSFGGGNFAITSKCVTILIHIRPVRCVTPSNGTHRNAERAIDDSSSGLPVPCVSLIISLSVHDAIRVR